MAAPEPSCTRCSRTPWNVRVQPLPWALLCHVPCENLLTHSFTLGELPVDLELGVMWRTGLHSLDTACYPVTVYEGRMWPWEGAPQGDS